MNIDNFKNKKSKQARKDLFPMGVGVSLGIVLGVAMDNIAVGLTVGIIIAGIVMVWQKKK